MKKTLYLVLLSSLIVGCAKHSAPTPVAKKTKNKKTHKVVKHNHAHGHAHKHSNVKKVVNKTKLCEDKEKIETVNRVGKRLAAAIDNKNIKWKFVVVENDTINATCFPDGYILITSGVFKAAKNEEQLATILAHEMAHVVAKHGKARINRSLILNGLHGAGTLIAGLINPALVIPFMAAYDIGTKHAVVYPSSRQEEQEADIIGLKIMKKANFNIDGAYDLWCNVRDVNKHKINQKSTTHITYEKRIHQIKCEIDKIKESEKLASNTLKK